MILKVKQHVINKNVQDEWMIFGDILNVEHRTLSTEYLKENKYPANYDWLDVNYHLKQIKIVTLTRRNGTVITIVFNNVAYLLSDEGKTIDTIHT